MTPVGNDHAARIDVRGIHAEVPERQRDNVARQPLAITRNRVDRARRQLAQHGQPFDQLGQLLKVLVEGAVERGAIGQRNNLPGFARMIVAQIVKLPDVILAPAGNRGLGDSQQLVGRLAHGRNHDDGLLVHARFDNRSHASDGDGGFDRGPAEFHDDHQSSKPSEYISSALSTAAPAAPRTVL